MDIRENVSLAPLTTFNIGGAARYFCAAHTLEEVSMAVQFAREKELPLFIMGGGSNLLISDEGFPGLVLVVANKELSTEALHVTVGAGQALWDLVRYTAAQGLIGMELLAGIPGTVGGAIRGNAGAFGTEMKDVIRSVEAYNLEAREMCTFSNIDCEFSYRMSFFKTRPEWIVWRAHIELTLGDIQESEAKTEETVAERNKRHIQDVQAAGSFFMNPVVPETVQQQFEQEKGQKSREGRVPAGWLIEKVGLKGATEGGAAASEQHPNYLVNGHNATAADVGALAERIQKKVHERFGVELHPEAQLVNCTLNKVV